MGDVMIVKSENVRNDNIKIKVKENTGKSWNEKYTKILNPHDYHDLALFFLDLKNLFNAPVEKAMKEMNDSTGFW
jgi:hypothetical protein